MNFMGLLFSRNKHDISPLENEIYIIAPPCNTLYRLFQIDRHLLNLNFFFPHDMVKKGGVVVGKTSTDSDLITHLSRPQQFIFADLLSCWVVFWLCVKTSLHEKQFIRNWVPPTGSFSCKSNSFSLGRFCKETRFETEAQGKLGNEIFSISVSWF